MHTSRIIPENKIYEVVIKNAAGQPIRTISASDLSTRHWSSLDNPPPIKVKTEWAMRKIRQKLEVMFPKLIKDGLLND